MLYRLDLTYREAITVFDRAGRSGKREKVSVGQCGSVAKK